MTGLIVSLALSATAGHHGAAVHASAQCASPQVPSKCPPVPSKCPPVPSKCPPVPSKCPPVPAKGCPAIPGKCAPVVPSKQGGFAHPMAPIKGTPQY